MRYVPLFPESNYEEEFTKYFKKSFVIQEKIENPNSFWENKIAPKYRKIVELFLSGVKDTLTEEQITELRKYLIFKVQLNLMKMVGVK